MAFIEAQKAKLIILLKILREKTDSKHGITVKDIIDEMDGWDIHVERKSLYRDFDTLRDCGYKIEKYKKGAEFYYALTEREFSLPELKLMVDAVTASKFLTTNQSDCLIKKLEALCSMHEAKELQRNVFLRDRSKTVNEVVFDNLGKLSEALEQRKRIDFGYYNWNRSKKLVLRENGEKKNISPCFMEFNDGVYYLIALEGGTDQVKHYRVDKMKDIVITEEKVSEKVYKTEFSNPALYSSKLTNMFGGENGEIRLEMDEDKVSIVIDRFGVNETTIFPSKDTPGKFICKVDVQISDQLFGWLFGVSKIIKLVGPEKVKKKYNELVKLNMEEAGLN